MGLWNNQGYTNDDCFVRTRMTKCKRLVISYWATIECWQLRTCYRSRKTGNWGKHCYSDKAYRKSIWALFRTHHPTPVTNNHCPSVLKTDIWRVHVTPTGDQIRMNWTSVYSFVSIEAMSYSSYRHQICIGRMLWVSWMFLESIKQTSIN